jgi:hypothetical protein
MGIQSLGDYMSNPWGMFDCGAATNGKTVEGMEEDKKHKNDKYWLDMETPVDRR